MIIADESAFDIISSTFTNNHATFDGGVMRVFGKSSFNITSSTFTNYSANIGGVMRIYGESSINIAYSTFSNNSANKRWSHDNTRVDIQNY